MKITAVFHYVAIYLVPILFVFYSQDVSCQYYENGQLYVCVYDSSGIPAFIGDTVVMANDSLRLVYTRYQVYAFDRAFPDVEAIKDQDTYLLNKVYLLKCHGDEDSLLYEIGRFASGIYFYQEKIPIYLPLEGNASPVLPDLSNVPRTYTPNDSLFNQDYALSLIRAGDAWDIEKGDPDILIGIPDFGFNTQHADLKTQIYRTLGVPTGNIYHGTAVAGCAAAATNNTRGKSAIGFKCRMITGYARWDTILRMSDLGAQVINASFITCSPCITHRNCVYYLSEKGTLMVAGAGNGTEGSRADSSGCDLINAYCYPASYDPVISVTSVGKNDNHIYSPGFYHTHNDQVDVCAPGYEVLSTCYNPNSNSCYSYGHWGTSFASPIVAGLAGLIYSARPCLKPEEVKYIIESTAEDIYDVQGNDSLQGKLGHGRIDAYRAVLKAKTTPNTVNLTISTNQEPWDKEYYIREFLIIKRGITLTIRGTVFFNANAKVIIEPGGQLILDGGTLRNNFCQGMWKGIEVQGQRGKSQLDPGQQGKIVLTNGATVKNALVAVSLVQFDSKGVPIHLGSGGIIQAENAYFINNRVAVNFFPYENHTIASVKEVIDNISYFNNVSFKTESRFIDPTVTPEAFAKLNGVRGIKFLGCTFINQIPLAADSGYFPETRGKGIYSHNSSFLVDKLTPSSADQCEFKYLFRGIEAYGTGSLKTVTVNEARFDTLCKAIYLKGINNATITRNTLSLFDSQVFLPDMAYGIFLDYCTGFKVEDNYLTKPPINHLWEIPDHYGIVVSNSLDDNNFIYNNTLDQLRVGILAQGNNRGTNGCGLQIKCNGISDCDFNIEVMPHPSLPSACGIAEFQGSGYSMAAPAANLFDRIISYMNESDYKIHPGCGSIKYYHNLYGPPYDYPIRPEDYTFSRILRFDTEIEYVPTTSCPSWINFTESQLLTSYKSAEIRMMDLVASGAPTEEVAYQYQLLAQAVNDLSKLYLQNTTTSFHDINTQLISLYENILPASDFRSKTWRYRLVFCYLAAGNTLTADKILNDIRANYQLTGDALLEHTQYVDYVSILKDLILTGKSVYEVTPAEKAVLYAIEQNHKSFVGIYARNIIDLLDQRPNQELIHMP